MSNVDSTSPMLSKVAAKRIIDHLFELSLMPHQVSPTGYTDPERKRHGEAYQRALKDIEQALGLREQS